MYVVLFEGYWSSPSTTSGISHTPRLPWVYLSLSNASLPVESNTICYNYYAFSGYLKFVYCNQQRHTLSLLITWSQQHYTFINLCAYHVKLVKPIRFK